MLSEFKDIFTYIYGKSGARLSPLVFVSLMSAISEALMLLQIIPIINLLMGINDAPFASFLEQKVILQMTFAQLLPFSFILCVIISNVCRFFTLKIATNLAMVMGLVPVVGVPLPLISYGGTVVMTVMFGFGLILSAHLHRKNDLPKSHV